MGGGSIWRGVTRVVTPAVRVGSASSATTTCSFCKTVGGAPAHAPRAQTARMRSCACSAGASQKAATTTSVSQQGSALWDSDEWEFAEEEERVDHLVFGSLPSRTEIEEASSELQNALRLGLMAPPQATSGDQAAAVTASRASTPPLLMGQVISSSSSAESSSSVTTAAGEEEVKQASEPKSLMATQLALDWVEPPPIRSWQGILTAGRRDNVAEAFRQFQHNPEVQSMVVSLATDPAVWDAVSANEKIQEFKRKLQKDKATGAGGGGGGKDSAVFAEVVRDVSRAAADKSPNVLARCQSFLQTKWALFMDVLTNIIDGLFSAADRKLFAEEDGDVIDRTVKSCTMLALVVLSIVILKRYNVQAA